MPDRLSALLAQHLIEEELLQQYPRWVRLENPSTLSSLLWMIFWPVGMFCIFCLQKLPSILFLLPSIPYILFVVLSLFGLRKQKNTAQLLRYGKAYPAVIEYIGTGSRLLDSTVGIAYWFQDGKGNIIRRTSRVGSHIPHSKKLHAGDTFTLLVSPDNENEVLPYFAVNEHSIAPVEATQVSHDVSARIASQIASQPVQYAGKLGAIEPEFLAPTPRQIRITRKQILKRLWFIGMIPVIFFTVPLLFTKLLTFWKESWIYFLFLGPLMASQFPNPFVIHMRYAWWLEKGTPTRAIVVDEYVSPSSAASLEEQTASFIYEYEAFNGEKVTGNVKFPCKRAWQLGFAKGTTFTVLYNKGNVTDHIPYFQITDAEIVGGMGARITPP